MTTTPTTPMDEGSLRDQLSNDLFGKPYRQIDVTEQLKVVSVMQTCRAYACSLARESLGRVRSQIGGEEEPDFDYGDATWGDSSYDHFTVVYGRNSAKGEVQGLIENELAKLQTPPKHKEEK